MPYEKHPSFESPASDARLWRYMDFAKFVALLESGTLFFASANCLGDPFEGTYPARNLDSARRAWPNMPRADWSRANEMAASERVMSKAARDRHCISCWHASESESDAMWKLYSAQRAGVAIHTTFADLCDAMLGHRQDAIYVGKVQYIDYRTAFMPESNGFDPFLHKRTAFAHELEVRAIVWVQNSDDSGVAAEARVAGGGIPITTDLRKLIRGVVVSPVAPPWFHKLIDEVLERYEITVPTGHSQLADEVPY